MCAEMIAGGSALLGALIGAGASVATTLLSNRHASKVSHDERKAVGVAKWREFQFANTVKLQEAGLNFVRCIVVVYMQLRKQFINGVPQEKIKASESDSEICCQSGAYFALLENRIADEALRECASEFRKSAVSST